MKIRVLKNFGLDGKDLEAGSVVNVRKALFGDNEAAFREGGFFEDFVPDEGAPVEPEGTIDPLDGPEATSVETGGPDAT